MKFSTGELVRIDWHDVEIDEQEIACLAVILKRRHYANPFGEGHSYEVFAPHSKAYYGVLISSSIFWIDEEHLSIVDTAE